MEDKKDTYKSLWQLIKRYICLLLENIKLSLVEKLTLIFSAIAFCFIAIIFSIVIVFFGSMALCHILSQLMDMHYVYIIMALFYLLMLVLVYVFRKILIINPISRFFSKLMLNPPKK